MKIVILGVMLEEVSSIKEKMVNRARSWNE
jgi:hypothetical protein